MLNRQHCEALRTQCFIDWLKAGGATLPSLEIRTVNGLRGVYTTKKIAQGELVYHIPRHLIVTSEQARNSPIGLRITTLGEQIMDVGYMTAFLLQNRREQGFWQPWIDAMPMQYSALFVFHRHAHNLLLRGQYWQAEPEALGEGAKLRKTMLNGYRRIAPLFESLTLHEFVTMYLFIMTRMFGIPNGNIDMVPFADMPNHAVPPQVACLKIASQGISGIALENIECGDQVHISYGAKSNGELLFQYGFCIPDNRFNLVKIGLPDIRPNHPFFEKTKTWGQRSGRKRIFSVSMNHEAPNAKRMFAYLRMACLEDMPALLSMSAEMSSGILPEVSPQNEKCALDALCLACQCSLDRFDRTLEEDEQSLTEPDVEWLGRCAIMAGQGEKRILKHYLEVIDKRIAAISSMTQQVGDYSQTILKECQYARPYQDIKQ